MNDDEMLAEHQRAWAGFVRVSTISTAAIIVLLILLAIVTL
ncbi:aa3-type cytochrome c oxidase subunit IV [Denitrobaculum tricleocarpae]|uniref:Aa3-type cytochrome c oxidase subunit IV n=1 Tax=Denitrobaculum tricleocarpae TaxID=2591009 RepID=A0A545TTX9_9PROT|nr:aa3-type cytochrome c oxidase subunit IV [Denitrobaculum tricleocarpae]TQV80666.1 aa3-type cytochrome c oxidase subunit IV [Denitrobaculum tricleocarpae]